MDSSKCYVYAGIEKIREHLKKTTIYYDSLVGCAYYFVPLDDVRESHRLNFSFEL